MSHQCLEGIGSKGLSIGGEGSPEVMKAVEMTRGGVLMILVARQIDASLTLNSVEFTPQRPLVVIPCLSSGLAGGITPTKPRDCRLRNVHYSNREAGCWAMGLPIWLACRRASRRL